MAKITIREHFEAPAARVFELFTDLENAPRRIRAISRLELLQPGPVGAGTRFRETRVMFGKEATEEIEITAFEPNRKFTAEAESHGARYVSTYRFVEADGGTDVELVFESRPVSLWAKLLSPLAPLMLKSVAKAVAEDMKDLKAVAAQQH